MARGRIVRRRVSIGVIVVLGVVGAGGIPAAVAARGGPGFSVRVPRSSRQAVLRARTLPVQVVARGYGRVRLAAVVRRGTVAQRRRDGSRLVRPASFRVHGRRTVRMRLTARRCPSARGLRVIVNRFVERRARILSNVFAIAFSTSGTITSYHIQYQRTHDRTP